MTADSPAKSLRWRYVRLWIELIGLSGRLYPARTAAMMATKVASAVMVAGTALTLRAAVNAIVAGDTRAVVIAAAGAALTVAAIAYLGILDTTLLFTLVEPIGLLHVGRQIQADIAGLDGLEHLERTDFLDRVTLVQGAGWQLAFGAWIAVDVVFSAIKLVLMLALLGAVSPWLLLLLVFASVPLWFDRLGQRGVSQAETDTAEEFRLQRHLFNLATEAAGGKEIRVAGAGDELARRQAQAWDAAVQGRIKSRLRAAAWKMAGWAVFTAGFTGGLAMVVYRVAHGQGSVGDIVLAITIAVTLRDSIQQTVMRATQAIGSGGVMEAYLWLRDYVAEQRAAATGNRPAPAVLRHGITFDRVRFAYPGTDRPALDELSCHLAAGSVVAVVGEYGSGKTSLIKLLCKFYRPDSGTIRIDDVDLSDLDTAQWRTRTSAAFQDFGRFQIRFAETVGLGDLSRLEDRAAVAEAVRAADAQDLVDRLPDGVDTQLGRKFDGVELSEGQWQKTALARASMRSAPLLFVLDEPTASLDAPSEHAIFERYMTRARELAARTGAITVIVSHRFSTVTGADQIIVLDKGRLVEAGRHEDLVTAGGRYAELYGLQANAYAPS
ncbi:MAG TPA: ABC transporter ATP-binding protein [Actinoplanes sp.]|jgi:ATP-binding cassette subfamily B protein